MRLVYIALGWTAGIILAANNTSGSPTISLIWLGLFGLSLISLWLAWQTQRWLMIALAAFTLGGLRMSLVAVTSDVARYNNSGGLTIEGIISSEPDARDDRILLRLDAETVTRAGQTFPTNGTVLVQAPPTTNVRYGDRVTATGNLITPAEADTFSYAGFLARGGVFSIMTNTAVETRSSGHGNPLYAGLLDFKMRAQTIIGQNLPEPGAALLTGILLGNERGIPPEVDDAFSAVGASHVVAISGFNMAILSGVIVGGLERLRVRRRWAALIAIGFIGVYTLLVGANAAVVRAAIMSSMLVVGALIRRKTYVPASLAFVALLLSAQNPLILWDVSFQLSFFATLGLALFADPLSRRFELFLTRTFPQGIAGRMSDFLTEPLIVSIAAQITTLPLILVYFGRLSPVSLIVNLLIIPVQAALLILGIMSTLLAFITPGIAQILYWFDLILLSWTIGIVRLFARLPYANVEFHVDPRLVILFFAVIIGGAMMQATQPAWALWLARQVRRRAVISATTFSGVSILILMGALITSRPDGNLHIWFLDMGHSNAALIQTPRGAHVLVDGGRFPSRLLTALGERLPFTDREIEALVISQPDDFDTGALVSVFERYRVNVILTNGQPNLSESYANLQAKFAESEVIAVRAGYNIEFDDGARLEILHPQRQPEITDSLNDQTLVLRLRYGDASFLFPSDLSREGQTELMSGGQWPLATVLQLPQHGAARSLDSGFLAAIQPQVAVVQSDRANRNGDPSSDILAMVGNTSLFRTDKGGTIHIWTDGHELWVAQ
jgi:competence protein ComEC